MITSIIHQSIEVKQRLIDDSECMSLIQSLVDESISTFKNNGKIILCGNGGSFADAQHISAEFTSRFMFDRDSLPSLALGCNNSTISATGNDYGYDFVFSRELSSIGNAGDIFIPISTSGNSPNILNAISVANEKKLTTFGLTGNKKGKMVDVCNCIEAPSDSTPRIQECHILIGHIVCEMVEAAMFNKVHS